MRQLGIVALLVMLLVIAGCGQKGPLYLPDDDEAAERYDPQGASDDDTDETDEADGN